MRREGALNKYSRRSGGRFKGKGLRLFRRERGPIGVQKGERETGCTKSKPGSPGRKRGSLLRKGKKQNNQGSGLEKEMRGCRKFRHSKTTTT